MKIISVTKHRNYDEISLVEDAVEDIAVVKRCGFMHYMDVGSIEDQARIEGALDDFVGSKKDDYRDNVILDVALTIANETDLTLFESKLKIIVDSVMAVRDK